VPHNSHFHPWSSLFTDRQRLWIALSDVGVVAMACVLVWACSVFGTANVVCYYFVPYLLVNLQLVLVTYLQHTDSYVPHFREPEFTWLRGALSTVDRSYGWLFDILTHHITDTHVVHHLFSNMPFYHAQEATEAVKPLLGAYYLSDSTFVPLALWRAWNKCKFVEDEGNIVFFQDAAAFAAGRKKAK
jgi:omega-6 fatty acid desaturase (delta-12 desaturase)